MNRLFCPIARLLAAGLLAVSGIAEAQNVRPPVAKEVQLPPELQALLDAAQPVWTASASVNTAVGYKDNLLLSQTNPARSGFSQAGVEALLWHVPRGKIDYYAFLNGEYTRYFKKTTDAAALAGSVYLPHTVDHEAQAFGGFEWRLRLPNRLTLTLDAQGYYLDQIFDVSDASVSRFIAALKAKGLKGGPTVRAWFAPWLWLEASGAFDRQKFVDGANDARIRDGTVRLGWTPSDRAEFSLSANELRRDYDRRHQVTKEDGLIDGILAIRERETEARADLTWGQRRRWTTRTRGGVLEYTDNAKGFLNYREPYGRQEIEWADGKWLVHLEGDLRRKHYDQQTAGAGPLPRPAVVRKEISGLLRIERKLSNSWTLFTEFQTDRSISNDDNASYLMKEGLLGVRWSWEK